MADLLMKQANAVIDERTTPICLHVAGQIRALNKPYNTLAGDYDEPPFHIHCRTISAPYMRGMVSDQRKLANAELKKRPLKERDWRKFENKIPGPTYKGTPLTKLADTATPRSVQVADRLIAERLPMLEQMTRGISGVADDIGGRMAGLGFRLKGRGSLAGKIARKARKSHRSMDVVGDSLGDVLRYTMVLPESSYTAGTIDGIRQLRALGYRCEVRNYWMNPNEAYQGTNLRMLAPDGTRVELQFHTPTSLRIKEKELHPLYDQIKEETDPARLRELHRRSFEAAAKIPVPRGVDRIR